MLAVHAVLRCVHGAARVGARAGPFFDEKATTEEPRWYSVDLKFVRKLKRLITLEELRKHDALRDMKLLNVSRLSTQVRRRCRSTCALSRTSCRSCRAVVLRPACYAGRV
jgi:predicted RNA-binding protein with PUA-like domain